VTGRGVTALLWAIVLLTAALLGTFSWYVTTMESRDVLEDLAAAEAFAADLDGARLELVYDIEHLRGEIYRAVEGLGGDPGAPICEVVRQHVEDDTQRRVRAWLAADAWTTERARLLLEIDGLMRDVETWRHAYARRDADYRALACTLDRHPAGWCARVGEVGR
jgi:hypothetical protein